MPQLNRKVIVRLRGGLGNQLFCYAAGRALAVRADAELVLDDVSDFAADHVYRRKFALDAFAIAGRAATHAERLEPLGKWRRRAARWLSRRQEFTTRRYIVEDHRGWDPRFLELTTQPAVTLDGYWQSYRYFEPIEELIRSDLRPAARDTVGTVASAIDPRTHIEREFSETRPSDATPAAPTIAVHYRWFGTREPDARENLGLDFYKRAIAACEERFTAPRYLLFSDDAALAQSRLVWLPQERTTVASTPGEDPTGVRELLQMSRCTHFVVANSSFSWWGAWLGAAGGKTVFAPRPDRLHADSFWRAPDLLPPEWIQL